MEIRTIELSGAALDWAVMTLEQHDDAAWYIDHKGRLMEEHGELSWTYQPSTNWAQGGPIIEREKLTLVHTSETLLSGKPIEWVAVHPDRYVEFDADGDVSEWHLPDAYGPTLLIAAMRCYVASKLGDEIEIPKELIK